MSRVAWGSRLGFIFAVAGSAIGLANIWRFPYMVGVNGGGAFLIVYLICLLLIGVPVFISEILIGRTTQSSPSGAFRKLGGSSLWGGIGKMTILTGFIVSSFYSAVAGWILGYLIEAVMGRITNFAETSQAVAHYTSLVENPLWGVSFHLFFMLACIGVLYLGVRSGIERGNKIMMPMLFVALILLMVKGLTLPNASEGLRFLFTPDWSAITPTAVIAALGHSFFTLSLGQGTMVTYGSYVGEKDNIVKSCFPVVIMDTVVSILAAVVVFTIVFSVGMEPASGPGLLFHTLPWVFSQITGGYFIAVVFFLLVVLAALTSEISAMEPTIAYLIEERGWTRHRAVLLCGGGAFLLGVPSALSFSLLSNYTFYGHTFLESVDFLATSIMIPLSGFFAVLLVGWVWGFPHAFSALKQGAADFYEKNSWLGYYFWFCFKYCAPVLMIIVFLNALGVFG